MFKSLLTLLTLVLLAAPSISWSGSTTNPVYSGSGGGGGLGTCPTGDICQDGSGNLVLNTAGAGVVSSPAAATGSALIFSEGSAQGSETISLGVGTTDLAGNVSCVFDSTGSLPVECPIFTDLITAAGLEINRAKITSSTLNVLGSVYDEINNSGSSGTGARGQECRQSGAGVGTCYIPFAAVYTLGPLVTTLDAGTGVAASCSELGANGADDCTSPITVSAPATGPVTWDITLSATVDTGGQGANDCSLIVWKDNTSEVTALRLTLDSTALTGSLENTVVTTTTSEVVLAGVSTSYGINRNGTSGSPGLNCDAVTDWDVVMTLEAVAQ